VAKKTKSRGSWAEKAARVGDLLPRARLHPAVLAWTAGRRKSGVWGVAFSGGADSLALLLVMWAHWPERRDRLVALHFNHRLRGRESAAEEKFCREVCAALGVRLRVGQWKIAGRALRPTVGRKARPAISEAEARAARHDFFARELKKLGTRTLWLAHQQDDIAESMLMRLARGSGTGGLAAPRPCQEMDDGRIHLRPLLTLKKAELAAVLRKAGAEWREDSSNDREDHFRNRIRRRVVPAWTRAAGRDALAGASLARERLEEDDRALEIWVEALRPLDRAGRLDLRVLAGMPGAVVRRAVHRWLLAARPVTDLSRQGFELLLAKVRRGLPTRFSLGSTGFAVIAGGKLKFKKS
jgi:tRNA(Ile)-lysidine synthase